MSGSNELEETDKFWHIYGPETKKLRSNEEEALLIFRDLMDCENGTEKKKVGKKLIKLYDSKVRTISNVKKNISAKISAINQMLEKKLENQETTPQYKIRKPQRGLNRPLETRSQKRNTNNRNNLYCFCGETFPDVIVSCVEEHCKIKLFHQTCVKTLSKNRKRFICQDCRNSDNRRSSNN